MPDGELEVLLSEPEVFEALLYGADYTDSGYWIQGGDYKERACAFAEYNHWPPFIDGAISWLRANDPPRENNVKLLLLCDVGGSMNPYSKLTSRLFSAAHQASHFKSFESDYFHNCPFETLYSDMARKEGEPTEDIFRNLDSSWRCIVVGDAAMAPTELTHEGGAVDYWHYNDKSGLYYLRKLEETIPRTVWLNPDPPKWWGNWSTRKIGSLFDMFPFTMEGLEDAVRQLRRKR
jgi:hypothetical protein